jgi:DNA-directed RNA polymerase specialized sigma24 family protein
MSSTPQSAGASEIDIPWNRLLSLARKVITARLGRVDATDADDLAQEVMIRLIRYTRRETPENVEALARTIAERVSVDFIRRRSRWRLVLSESVDIADLDEVTPAASTSHWGDPVERVGRVLIHGFQGTPECMRLAEKFLANVAWNLVAEELGQSHAAIRQRWKRCLDTVRRELEGDHSLRELLGW